MQLKKFISACTLSMFLASSAGNIIPAKAATSANIIIDDIVYQCDSLCAPQNINNRVYVPLRVVSEGLGHSVDWDNSTRSVLIDSTMKSINTSVSTSSSVQIYLNNKPLVLNSSTGIPYITPNGYTMVPIRLVAENLGTNVNWNGNTNSVIITTTSNSNFTTNNTRPQSANQVSLLGSSYCSLEQMQRYIVNIEATIKTRCDANGKNFVAFPSNIAYLYYTMGQKYGIRGDVALAQAIFETGYFQFGNNVKAWQNNYCGLGSVGHTVTADEVANSLKTNIDHNRAWLQEGIYGWIFSDVATGVEAHIQHLYSYATTAALPSNCTLVDGRFNHGNRGIASVLTDLNGRWALPGDNYGENIYNNILVSMMNS